MIEIRGVFKSYRIGERQRYLALRDILAGMIKNPLRLFSARKAKPHFWALKDISLKVGDGEVVGIIGRNGAGKTTLLKILSRITEPTRGEALLYGRVGSLLEVGTGFHPELTGRENIYFNGSILGMRKREINRKFEEIVSFSGVEKFLDTPVKRFSSGMKVRLAFSVAAHLEPEILLVDEVLAVGDAQFQKKCLGKMREISKSGRTVLFVSHNMSAITNLCRRTILLEDGGISLDGETAGVVARYLDDNLSTVTVVPADELERKMEGSINRGHPSIRAYGIKILNQRGQPANTFNSDERIEVEVGYQCITEVTGLIITIYIVDEENRVLMATQNIDAPEESELYRRPPGLYRTSCTFAPNIFGQRRFYASIHLQQPLVEHIVFDRIIGFDVVFTGFGSIQYGTVHNTFFRPCLKWKTENIPNITEERDEQ